MGLGGLLIGATQLLSILTKSRIIGASAAFPFIGYKIISRIDPKWQARAPFYKDYQNSSSTLLMAAGMMSGGFLSSYLGGVWGMSAPGVVEPFTLFLGGVLLVYGSRLADGCTSGHGISGVAMLSASSILTVASMFAGGIGLGLLLG